MNNNYSTENFLFIFPVFGLTSYRYSGFRFNFRKQDLKMKIKSTSKFSYFVFLDDYRINCSFYFFDYFLYLFRLNFYNRKIYDLFCKCGVYSSVFFSGFVFNSFVNNIPMLSILLPFVGFFNVLNFIYFNKVFFFLFLRIIFILICRVFLGIKSLLNKYKSLFMPTFHQIITRKSSFRKSKKKFVVAKALRRCPHLRGVCIKVYTVKPKKPNSANRKVAKLRLSTGKKIIAYVHGSGNRLQQHSVVLVRGGRRRDIPGIHYQLLRGKYDFNTEENFMRKNRRSKFGVKKNK